MYTGSNLLVEGEGCRKPIKYLTPTRHYTIHTPRSSKTKDVKDNNESCAKKVNVKFLSPKAARKLPEKADNGHSNNTNSLSSTKILKKEMKHLLSKGKKVDSWKAYVCDTENNCNVVSAYHVQNASLEVSDDSNKNLKVDGELTTPKRLSSHTLKLARMHRKTKKKVAYATLKYHRTSDGMGLSIGPGNGVSQI